MISIADATDPYQKTLTLLIPEVLYTDPDGAIDIEMTIHYNYVTVVRNRGLRALAAEEEEIDLHDRQIQVTHQAQLLPMEEGSSGGCGMTATSVLTIGSMVYVALMV